MATSNKAVTTYLPPQIEESLTQYCVEHGLTRKGREGELMPSLGTGIVEALKDYFQLSQDSDTGLSKRLEQYFDNSLSSQVRDLVKDLVIDSSQVELMSRVAALEKKVQDLEPDKVQDSPDGVVVQDSHPGQLELLSQVSHESRAKPSILPISGVKLSEIRFGIGKSTLAGKKRAVSAKEFARWTVQKDPDGILWKFVELPSKGYVPDGDLPSEVKSKLLSWLAENLPEFLESAS